MEVTIVLYTLNSRIISNQLVNGEEKVKRINRIISILLAVCVMLSIAAFNGVTVDAADNSSISANNQLVDCGGAHSGAIKKMEAHGCREQNIIYNLGTAQTDQNILPNDVKGN